MRKDIPIMVVEDDFLDAKNIERAFKKNSIQNELRLAPNGRRALDELAETTEPRPAGERKAAPGIILLDLNMPIMNGVEFLEAVKGDARFKDIPVVVLTSSSAESDLETCYALGASGYIVKPILFDEMVEMLRRFDQYWSVCELPRRG